MTHEQLTEDIKRLKRSLAGRTSEYIREAFAFMDQAQANLDCYLIFDQVEDRQSFLDAAYRLQARAWLRAAGFVQ